MGNDMNSNALEKRIRVNFQRLKNDIQELGDIGRGEDRGLYRQAFSPADMEGREWLKQRILDAGLQFSMDGAANLHATLQPDHKQEAVIIGSHIDTVPGGGRLDGALGVLSGLEALRVIKESGITLKRPIELISFTDEEGRFGGLFGSQSFAGHLTPEKIEQAVDLNGVFLVDAMKHHGLNAMDALDAIRKPRSIHSYLELHIEQGGVLDAMRKPAAVVNGITGLFKWQGRLTGESNHAGTTPMDRRVDAFRGLAEFAGRVDDVLAEHGSESSVATIGKVNLFPGTANVVPGVAEFSLDVRDTDFEVLRNLQDGFRSTLSAIARKRKLKFDFEQLSEIEPALCDPGIMEMIRQSGREMGLDLHTMPSGSVHDALILARIARMGMILVPSKNGISHSPEEWTDWEDIETGANLTLSTLVKLASSDD